MRRTVAVLAACSLAFSVQGVLPSAADAESVTARQLLSRLHLSAEAPGRTFSLDLFVAPGRHHD